MKEEKAEALEAEAKAIDEGIAEAGGLMEYVFKKAKENYLNGVKVTMTTDDLAFIKSMVFKKG